MQTRKAFEMKALEENDVPKARLLFSQRSILAFMALLGNLFVYVVRVNLSVAILCMVRSDTPSNVTSYSSNVTKSASQSDGACEELLDMVAGGKTNDRGEFTWDKSTQSRLLSMYFYGYIFTQIPGGWLASRYGGKRVWGTCMLISALCTLATPISARTNLYLAFALRFVLGFSAGVTFPCVHALLGRWSPPFERSKMGSYTFAGPLVGNIITFSVSGYMCEYGFDNGWGSIFYLAGIFNMIWVIAWFLLTADTPEQHKRISQKELRYINHTIGRGNVHKVRRVPWVKMIKSGPLWAIIITHFGNNYTNYTLLTSLPTFMKEALKFDIKQNGVLSALPYVSQLIFSLVAGFVADSIREKRWLTTKTVRKIFQSLSLFGMAACIVAVGQMHCSQRYLAVFVLCLCTAFLSCNRAGYAVNHLDLAPSYSGILFGFSNTAATIPGMIAPIIAGVMTPNKSAEEWRNVFYVCAAVAVLTGLCYLWLADGELQKWANPDFFRDLTVEITYRAADEPVDDVKESVNCDNSHNNLHKPNDEAKEVLIHDDSHNDLERPMDEAMKSHGSQNNLDEFIDDATQSLNEESTQKTLKQPSSDVTKCNNPDSFHSNLEEPMVDVTESTNADCFLNTLEGPLDTESIKPDDIQINLDKPLGDITVSIKPDVSQSNMDNPVGDITVSIKPDDSESNLNKPVGDSTESNNQADSQNNLDKPAGDITESNNPNDSQSYLDKPVGDITESNNPDDSQSNLGKPVRDVTQPTNLDFTQSNLDKPIGDVTESNNPDDSQNNVGKPVDNVTDSNNPDDSYSNLDKPIGDVMESNNPNDSQSNLDKPIGDIIEASNPDDSQSNLDRPIGDITESNNPDDSQSNLDKPIGDITESNNPNDSQSNLDKPIGDITESNNPDDSQSNLDKTVSNVTESNNRDDSQSNQNQEIKSTE